MIACILGFEAMMIQKTLWTWNLKLKETCTIRNISNKVQSCETVLFSGCCSWLIFTFVSLTNSTSIYCNSGCQHVAPSEHKMSLSRLHQFMSLHFQYEHLHLHNNSCIFRNRGHGADVLCIQPGFSRGILMNVTIVVCFRFLDIWSNICADCIKLCLPWVKVRALRTPSALYAHQAQTQDGFKLLRGSSNSAGSCSKFKHIDQGWTVPSLHRGLSAFNTFDF